MLGTRLPAGAGFVNHAPVELMLWEARTGKHLRQFHAHQGNLGDARFSPDGKFLATIGQGDETLRIWDVATGRQLHRLTPGPRALWYLAFSRDSRVLALGGLDPEIHFWEVPSGKELPKLAGPEMAKRQPSGVNALVFLPDGKRLVASDHCGKLFVWDRETGRLVKEWQAHKSSVSQLALSADGRTLVSRGASTALVWDLACMLTKE
jgi:WD40 repeat protein